MGEERDEENVGIRKRAARGRVKKRFETSAKRASFIIEPTMKLGKCPGMWCGRAWIPQLGPMVSGEPMAGGTLTPVPTVPKHLWWWVQGDEAKGIEYCSTVG